MEDECLVTILTLPDIPVDKIPFEVGRVDCFSTFTPRYSAFLPRLDESRIKKQKKLEKMLLRFVYERVSEIDTLRF